VYRFGGRTSSTVFADRAELFRGLSEEGAARLARTFAPDHAATIRYVELVTDPDQWTLQSRAHLPLHRVALGDKDETEIYISARTGELVMDTTRHERLWAYLGPVAHWLYLPVLRRNGPLWTRVIIWSSLAGCALCISGLLAGSFGFRRASDSRCAAGGRCHRTPDGSSGTIMRACSSA
jgi:hypothetical protein